MYHNDFVFSVTAYDGDQGRNGEIRYSFSPDSEIFSEVFSIDHYTGWITNLVSLDKETKSEYRFHVIASDNGHPKHTARTNVFIKLIDYNDQPTLFKRKIYETAVNEDIPRGKLLIFTLSNLILCKKYVYFIEEETKKNQHYFIQLMLKLDI